MRIEIHVLQNVAPANLNRDDTNSPKDAIFGGYRRARLSSQSQKRAVRNSMANHLPQENLGVRTKLLVSALIDQLSQMGHEVEELQQLVPGAVEAIFKPKEKKGKKIVDEDGKTSYLLFLGRQEISKLADILHAHYEELKAKKFTSIGKAVEDANLLDGGRAVDVALFGRMLADRADLNVDAAAQVAHAISTHKVDREFDFYTAVDDLNPKEETGAGMMGDVEFYSATLYRYAQVDVNKLLENLQKDRDLALRGLEAFLRAFPRTLPSGKQNTFAAHNEPDFIAVVVKDGAPRNLANAFLKPVRVSRHRPDDDLMENSVESLSNYWKTLDNAYGKDGEAFYLNLSQARPDFEGQSVNTFEELVNEAMKRVRERLGV